MSQYLAYCLYQPALATPIPSIDHLVDFRYMLAWVDLTFCSTVLLTSSSHNNDVSRIFLKKAGATKQDLQLFLTQDCRSFCFAVILTTSERLLKYSREASMKYHSYLQF